MPTSMILRRSEDLADIAAGKSNTWIAQNCAHGGELIREIRAALEGDPRQISVLGHTIGDPPKLLSDVMERINVLTAANPAM
jgi:hypothetical protein